MKKRQYTYWKVAHIRAGKDVVVDILTTPKGNEVLKRRDQRYWRLSLRVETEGVDPVIVAFPKELSSEDINRLLEDQYWVNEISEAEYFHEKFKEVEIKLSKLIVRITKMEETANEQ